MGIMLIPPIPFRDASDKKGISVVKYKLLINELKIVVEFLFL